MDTVVAQTGVEPSGMPSKKTRTEAPEAVFAESPKVDRTVAKTAEEEAADDDLPDGDEKGDAGLTPPP